jgi:hypothetical protein
MFVASSSEDIRILRFSVIPAYLAFSPFLRRAPVTTPIGDVDGNICYSGCTDSLGQLRFN